MDWEILSLQPETRPFAGDIALRMDRLAQKRNELAGAGTLADFANGHLYFGLHRTESGWVYREWAPAAEKLCLTGDFNGWNRESHPLKKKENGVWEITLPGRDALRHLSRCKVSVTAFGRTQDRIPLYARYVCQDDATKDFCAVVWAPETPFEWTDAGFPAMRRNRRLSMRPMWAWRPRNTAWAPTGSLPISCCPASNRAAMTRCSSWLS